MFALCFGRKPTSVLVRAIGSVRGRRRIPGGTEEDRMEKARKALLLVIAVLGACAVAAQFYLNTTRHPEHTALWRAIDFASYFTNTTGILVTIVATLGLLRPSAKLAQPGGTAAAAIYISVVAVTYEL